jgi:ABC-type transport system involved in multi-copper enzyme maturation permease subunit
VWTLIRKDLIFNRRMLGLNLAFYLLLLPVYASLVHDLPPPLYAGFAAVICSMVPLTLVAREDKFRTAALTCSLPVTRDAIVSARYWGGGLVTLAAIAAILAAGYLVPQTGFAAHAAGVGRALLVAFVIAGLVQAALLPFTIRFGLAGLMVFLVGTQVLGIVALLSAMLLGLDVLRGVIGTIGAALRAVREWGGDAGLAAVLVTAVALLNVASHRLSRRLYRAREF